MQFFTTVLPRHHPFLSPPIFLTPSPPLPLPQGEFEYYDASCKALAAAGVAVPAYPPFSVFGFPLKEPPHIVFHPNFAVSFANFKSKFPTPGAVAIAPRSTLVVKGGGVTISGLTLDGALTISAVEGAVVHVKRLTVKNAGWELVPLQRELL